MMRADAGQALIVAALCFTVLLGALALAADWGRGLAVRQVSQNEADAAALVAGKVLATSYSSAAGPRYRATSEDVWTFAACALRGNRPAFAAGGAEAVAVRFGSVAPPEQVAVTSWTATVEDDAATAPCPARVTGAGTPVPDDTAYVEVRVVGTHKAMIGAVGQQALTVAASSRVRIAGLPVARAVPVVPGSGTPGVGVSGAPPQQDLIWPLVRHFEASDYTTPCGQFCDPNSRDVDRITFWSFSSTGPTGRDVRRFGGFLGLIDPSHYSLRQREVAANDKTHQLVTSSDYSGSLHAAPPTAPLPNRSATCAAPTWDSNGTIDPAFSVQCNIANWFSYGYRGGLSVGTDWSSVSWGGYRGAGVENAETPTPLPTSPLARATCAAQSFFVAPSCAGGPDSSAGDWVETYRQPLDAAQRANLVGQMQDFIARNGRTVEWSDRLVARGPNAGSRYGKAAVVNIALWDCAETFRNRVDHNDRWDLVRANVDDGDPADCSQLTRRDTRVTPIDRVHLFAVAPFTFYAGLVSVSAVEAYWGGAYGDEGSCRPGRACDAPNPLKNTAFLVPTE